MFPLNENHKLKDKIKNNVRHCALFILLLAFLIVIIYFRLRIQMDIGPGYDTYDFLANAAEFAGKSIGYSDVRPPFLSFLTSIFFRFEGLSINPIFYVDALIDALGVIGLYLFLKLKFNSLNSFLGSLLYATFPIVLTYIGVGFPDLPSVSISIWALYLTVLAVKSDSKFFFLSFPLAMISFLTRYNQALIIFPIFLFILINWQKVRKDKNMFIGIVLSFLIITPFLLFYALKYGSPLYPFTDFYGTSSGSVSNLHFDYNPDPFFYVKLFPYTIGNAASLIVLTIIGGLLIGWLRLVQGKRNLSDIKHIFTRNRVHTFIILILAVVFISSISRVPYILSEILFFVLCLASFKLFKIDPKYNLDLLFLSWFVTFLIFNSVFLVKDVRYFLTMMPAVSYFLIRGLVLVENQVGLIKNKKLTFYLAPLIVIVLIISTFYYVPSIESANQKTKILNDDMSVASLWLANYDPAYKSKVVYSDLWPHSGWYLQMNVGRMPEFQNNKTYYNSLKNYEPTDQDSIIANEFLVENNAEYYFSIRNWVNLSSYKPIKQFGDVIIYKRG